MLSIVTRNKPKEVDRLEPKGKREGYSPRTSLYVNVLPPVYDLYLSYPKVIMVERGKPVYSPSANLAIGRSTVRQTEGYVDE